MSPLLSTTTIPPGRHTDQLIERALAAYAKAGGREQPSTASDVHDINGSPNAILRNCNGLLAAYCLQGVKLKRLSSGEAIAADLFAQAFERPRDPRSAEYRTGVLAALQFRLAGHAITRPYSAGTAADDAFDAGMVEGHALWRRAQEGGAA